MYIQILANLTREPQHADLIEGKVIVTVDPEGALNEATSLVPEDNRQLSYEMANAYVAPAVEATRQAIVRKLIGQAAFDTYIRQQRDLHRKKPLPWWKRWLQFGNA